MQGLGIITDYTIASRARSSRERLVRFSSLSSPSPHALCSARCQALHLLSGECPHAPPRVSRSCRTPACLLFFSASGAQPAAAQGPRPRRSPAPSCARLGALLTAVPHPDVDTFARSSVPSIDAPTMPSAAPVNGTTPSQTATSSDGQTANDNIRRFVAPSRPLSPPAAHTLFHPKTRCFV